ncbi:MAG: hypothetical protein Kow0062_20860 [Acidobacteriota bacterium]
MFTSIASRTSVGIAVVAGLAAPAAAAAAADLPLLPAGPQLSVLPHGYFEPPAAGTESALDALLAQAVSRGDFSASYELDWVEIEPDQEIYDLDGFRQRFVDWEARGMTHFWLNISAISIDSLGVPPDLLDPDDPSLLRDGMHIDDPVVVARYLQMLDQVLPIALAHGTFALGAGNEVNDYFQDHPGEADHFVAFLRAVREHVRTIEPRLPVGVILTKSVVLDDQPWHGPILAESDLAGYNYYALDPGLLFAITDEATIRGELRALVRAAGGRPILIQELGMPTGLDGVTEAEQARIARIMYEELYDHRQVRWVSWFKMSDFSQAFADAWGQQLLDEGNPPWFVDRLKAWLRGSGLCVYETGAAKQAWDVFLGALDRAVLDVRHLRWSDETNLTWDAPARAESYDVARGEVSRLRADGDLSAAVAVSCSQTASGLVDEQVPPPGEAFYHVVRARAGASVGSWGRIARDASVTACP